MTWTFTKMHGAGNDFVVLDGVRQRLELTPERMAALAHRHFGVGADQILIVEPPNHPEAHFRYRIFNADGSEVEHCGNGARCFARFVHEQGLSRANPIRAEIATGLIELALQPDGSVSVAMGSTRFSPADVGFDTTGLAHRQEADDTLWQLDTPAAPWLSLVAISNPHAVQVVANIDHAPVTTEGPLIERHPRFANRVNAGFMQVLTRQHIRLRVYERGAGETLACGTGACAAVAAGIRRGLLQAPVQVDTQGGRLVIDWQNGQLMLTGPATTVYQGTLSANWLQSPLPT